MATNTIDKKPFKPALVVVDVQEDFCPPRGPLKVEGGRDIVPLINTLLSLPFPVKVATQDFHPPDHISFASTHEPPNNIAFYSIITISNPKNPKETQKTRLWPNHCIQGTDGVKFLPNLNLPDDVYKVQKGKEKDVEMYSAFGDPFETHVYESELAGILKNAEVTDVFVCGLAADYCVKYTALDARKKGYTTWVLEEATKAVAPEDMKSVYKEYNKKGVTVIKMDHEALKRVTDSMQPT